MQALKAIVPAVMAISLVAATIAGCHLPGKTSRVMERADRYFKAGEYDKARIEYLNVLKLDRTNRSAIRQLGVIYFEEGGDEEENGLGDLEDAGRVGVRVVHRT